MKNNLMKSLMFLILSGMQLTQAYGQTKTDPKLQSVAYEVPVSVTTQQAWKVLTDFGNAGSFHSQLESSKSLNGTSPRAELGCERECIIPDGKKKIMVRERIIELVEGQYYTYEVYEWKNFPINTFYVTFGVKTDEDGKTIVYQRNDYRLKPGFLTGMMKGKLRNGAREGVLAYKHYMENGEAHADMELIKQKYKDL